MRESDLPFPVPDGYAWLIDRGLVGFEPFSALQPWHFLPTDQIFSVSERWPKPEDGERRIFAFARRQDCDDLACFAFSPAGRLEVLTVHGWTDDGYQLIGRHASIWDWLKVVIDDVREWVEGGEPSGLGPTFGG